MLTKICLYPFACTSYNRSTWLILVMPNVIGTQIVESILPLRNTENLDWMLVILSTSRLVPFVEQSAGEKLNEIITMPHFSNLCFCFNLSFSWLNFLVKWCFLILYSLSFSQSFSIDFFYSSRLVTNSFMLYRIKESFSCEKVEGS